MDRYDAIVVGGSFAGLSAAMMLRYSLGMPDAADRIEAAVAKALSDGARSFDLGGSMNTSAMGDAVLAAL